MGARKLPRITDSQLLMLQPLTPELEELHVTEGDNLLCHLEQSLCYSEPIGVKTIVSRARRMCDSALCSSDGSYLPLAEYKI